MIIIPREMLTSFLDDVDAGAPMFPSGPFISAMNRVKVE